MNIRPEPSCDDQFADELRRLAPVAAALDPADVFYRAGYAAARAEHQRWRSTFALVGSAAMLLVVITASGVSYYAGHGRGREVAAATWQGSESEAQRDRAASTANSSLAAEEPTTAADPFAAIPSPEPPNDPMNIAATDDTQFDANESVWTQLFEWSRRRAVARWLDPATQPSAWPPSFPTQIDRLGDDGVLRARLPVAQQSMTRLVPDAITEQVEPAIPSTLRAGDWSRGERWVTDTEFFSAR